MSFDMSEDTVPLDHWGNDGPATRCIYVDRDGLSRSFEMKLGITDISIAEAHHSPALSESRMVGVFAPAT